MKYAGIVFKNLFRNTRRTTLTVFSIAVSLFIFSALTSVPIAVNQVLSAMSTSERLVVHNKASLAYGLPPAYLPKILALPHVEAAVAQSWFGGIYHEVSDQFPNWALDLDGMEKVFPDWKLSPQTWEEFKKKRRACLIGPETLKRFHLKVGQQIMLRPTFPMYPSVQLEIVGVAGGKALPNVLVFRRDYLQEAVKALSGQYPLVNFIWVMPGSGSGTQVTKEIDELFANSSAETQTETEQAFVSIFMENYRLIFNMAKVLGIVVVFTIGLVAANTAAMSIRERRNEIAVMRSLGFPSSTILSILLTESVLVGLIGGIVGCVCAFMILKGARLSSGVGTLTTLRMPPAVLAETMLVGIVIGFLSALVPALSAVRRSIVDTMRAVA